MSGILYTIGHSNYSLDAFLELLRRHEIEMVCDVRSSPYSAYCPHFNREALVPPLQDFRFEYAFLGRELGARTEDTACYRNGKVSYALLAETEPFRNGLREVKSAMQARRVALMCAEKDPLTCHRSILICRHLRDETDSICHILETGEVETQHEAEYRLLKELKIDYPDLFNTEEELIEQAYDTRGEKIAFALREAGTIPEVSERWP